MKKLSILAITLLLFTACTQSTIKVTTVDTVELNQDNVWRYSFNEFKDNEFKFYATEGQNPIVQNSEDAINTVKENIVIPECDGYYGLAVVQANPIPFPEGESTVGRAPLAEIVEIKKLEKNPTCYK